MTAASTQLADHKRLVQETAALIVNQPFRSIVTSSESDDIAQQRRAKEQQQIASILHSYSAITLKRLIETTYYSEFGWKIRSFLIGRAKPPTERYLNDWLTLQSFERDGTIDDDLFLNGLETYKQLASQGNGLYPIQRTEAVRAIHRISTHFRALGTGLKGWFTEQNEGIVTIEDEELRDLIAAHENPHGIADLIIQRILTDPNEIKALIVTMSGTARAINDGIL